MKFPVLLILLIIFASISVGTTYAVLDTFDNVKVTNNLIVDNKVGIGTDSPSAKLDVDGIVRVGGGRMQIGGFDGANNFIFRAGIPGTTAVFMVFHQNPDGSADWNKISPAGQIGLFIEDTGDVGVGKTNPTEALDVEGNIKLSGNIVSNGDICIGTCT